MTAITLDAPLTWTSISQIAKGASLHLSDAALERVKNARRIVEAIVDRDILGYGINTGVGALCNDIVGRDDQADLSRNIIMSHACGVGTPLGREETRAIMAAMVNMFAHGYSGVRAEIPELLCALLNSDCTPVVPSAGSVGYLSHASAISLVLIGCGKAKLGSQEMSGQEALDKLGLKALTLEAKEGLSLVNGTCCSSGLSSLAISRAEEIFNWGTFAAAASFEAVGSQLSAFDEQSLALRKNVGVNAVGQRLRTLLMDSQNLKNRAGSRTQDCLSLRAIPQVHGAVFDAIAEAGKTINLELSSVTDNPTVMGTPEEPQVYSQAHAVGASAALAMDNLATACSLLASISERRTDRMINPLVSGLPPFLAPEGRMYNGFQVVQLTAVSLVGECRRLASPVSLSGGISAALQEDILTHATPAALNTLQICDKLSYIVSIELLTAFQALRFSGNKDLMAPEIKKLFDQTCDKIPLYQDQAPIGEYVETLRGMVIPPKINGVQR